MNPTGTALTKSEWRAEGLRRRRDFARALSAGQRAGLETRLARIVLPHLADAQVIGAYHSLRDEISPHAIVERLSLSQTAAFPWFAGRDLPMIWRASLVMEPGPWGMGQPPADAPTATPDLLIVPLVLADRGGVRIGHGQGHFDRALARLRETAHVRAIGIGWSSQVVEGPLPADPWDVHLDALATPDEWIDCA
ncbi:MAG: 5-formyltetrahydrofolate cyclo-ligase [Sphingosinicella sp.]